VFEPVTEAVAVVAHAHHTSLKTLTKGNALGHRKFTRPSVGFCSSFVLDDASYRKSERIPIIETYFKVM